MPKLTVSKELHEQIEAESGDSDVEKTLWKMVGSYRRRTNPEADVTEE